MFKLITKTSSQPKRRERLVEGLEIEGEGGGVLVRTSTYAKGADNMVAVSEALCFLPNMRLNIRLDAIGEERITLATRKKSLNIDNY